MTSSNDRSTPSDQDESPGGDHISDSLKRIYNGVAEEPLPDKLSELLEKLKKGDSA